MSLQEYTFTKAHISSILMIVFIQFMYELRLLRHEVK